MRIIGAYFGEGYAGFVPEDSALGGMRASEQFVALARALANNSFDVRGEVAANHVTVFLNFFFWEAHDFSRDGFLNHERQRVLEEIRKMWTNGSFPVIPLGLAREP